MRRLGVIAVSAWAICLAIAGCSSTVGGTAVVGPGAATSATGKANGLPALLLSLDEMKQLLKFDDIGVEDTVTQPDARGIYEPAGCVGAVFSSMAGSYDGSGYRDFYEVRLSDVTGGGPPHWVDQSAATFDNSSAAKDFVANQVAQRRGRPAVPRVRPDRRARTGHQPDPGSDRVTRTRMRVLGVAA